ncbi:protein kinase A regulatory subunit binding [Mactra antiquata]
MSSMRAIVTIAVPAVTVLFGLLWYFRRKQPTAAQKSTDPPDKKERTAGYKPSKQNEKSEVINGSSEKSSINSNVESSAIHSSKFVLKDVRENIVEKNKTPREPGVNEKGDAIVTKLADYPETLVTATKGDDEHLQDDTPKPVVTEEIVETIVQQSFTKPSFKAVNQEEAHNSDDESSESPVTVKSFKQEIISPVEENTLQSTFNTASHDSVKIKVEPAADKTSENSLANLSQGNHSSQSLPVTDSDTKLSESNNSDVNKVTDPCSVLEDQIIQDISEPMSRSWCDEIPEDSTIPDLSNSVCPDTSNLNSNTSLNNAMNGEKFEVDQASLVSNNNVNATNDSKTKCANENVQNDNQVDKLETNNSDSSSNCDNLSEASNDSGKGGSVNENVNQSTGEDERLFEFNIPSDLCGLFIGRGGKTIKMICQQSGAKIRLQNNPYTPNFQICVIEGTQKSIDCACRIIRKKFPDIRFPSSELPPSVNTMIMPEIMQLSLPDGVLVDIVVSSIVDAGRIFVQQPTHPSYPSLDRLNVCMNQCYMREGNVPDIPRPIESGVICAAPMLNGWYRAQIMATYEETDECDIKYVDYGGYSRISNTLLKQIRSDFMTLPFEAVECYMANITHLEYEQYFSAEAAVVLEELTQGKMLQARVTGHAEDGTPYVEISQLMPPRRLAVNREMVQRGVVRWMEQLE